MKKAAKVVHTLDSPLADIKWPEVSKEVEQTITQLLCILLTPIGDHRRQHIIPSRGRRRRKAKRKPGELGEEEGTEEIQKLPPQVPQISHHVYVGFNSTVRVLEWWSEASKPMSFPSRVCLGQGEPQGQPAPLAAIFVCRSSLPVILTASIPLLTTMASLGHLDTPPVRLVTLPEKAEGTLASALHLARVGVVGISSGAPGAESLIETVRGLVPPVTAPVLHAEARYRPVQIRSTEIVVNGPAKKDDKFVV